MHHFWRWVQRLDQVLRGHATSLPALRGGRLDIPVGGLAVVLVILAMVHGFCVGWFAIFNRPTGPSWAQVGATVVKMPLLFFFTLVVTFPSLYVFNTLVGSRLTLRTLLQLLVAAMGVTLAVLTSFGPIVAFFSLTTTNYPFMGLLNVLVCAVAGLLGLAFLLQTLHRLTVAMRPMDEPPAPEPETAAGAWPETPVMLTPLADQGAAGDAQAPFLGEEAGLPGAEAPAPPRELGPLDPLERHVLERHTKTVFRCWVIVFGLVGAQMSWVLRPFIGDPRLPFALIRPRGSNFFLAVWEALRHLFI